MPEGQRRREMTTFKLQFDYVLTRNIYQPDIRKSSKAVWYVAFDSNRHPILLNFKIRFHKRNREVPLQPKIGMAELFTKCIQNAANETLPAIGLNKKFDFASAETRFRSSVQYGSTKDICLVETRYHNTTPKEVIEYGSKKLLRNFIATCYVQGLGANLPGSAYQITRNEQVCFRLGRSTIEQVFKRVIEIWQRYSKPMQLAFLNFEAAFDSPHRGHFLNGLRVNGVLGKFVRVLDNMIQQTTAAVQKTAGCTSSLEVVTGLR
ncbi:hypothetical protein RB195_018596 [Necator americanus]|uniref:Reverse transcriptase domain-containing protein n=1 Tax=Necator americanus TaxID=51031 RepID=A0ABR1CAG6_NECAM